VVRWHLGFYPSTLLEDAIVVTVVIFLVETFREGKMFEVRSPFLWPAILFAVAGALDVVTAPSMTAALGLYRAYLLEPMAFALVLANVLRNQRRAMLVAGGLMVGAAVAGVANSYVVLTGLIQPTYDVTQTPPVVIYFTANAVALYVVPLVAVAGALALHARQPERLFGAVFLLLGVVITMLSFSRGGYLALAAVIAGLALSHRRRWALLGLAVLAVAGMALIEPIRHRVIIETENVYGNTVQSRLDLWTGAIKLIEQRPLFGAGLSGFQERVAPFLANFHASAFFIDPHNILLNFWVETGLLGVIAIAWIIGAAMWISCRGWRAGSAGWSPFHLGVLLALVAVIVHGLVDVPYFKNDLSLEFWTLVTITWAGRRWASEPEVLRTPARPEPQPAST
jgi:putative inorganic carbon (HCO3(-)) transporter